MKKVMLVFGTHPAAIKMALLVKEFQRRSDVFETVIRIMGQHCTMLDQFVRLFEIRPDHDLNI